MFARKLSWPLVAGSLTMFQRLELTYRLRLIMSWRANLVIERVDFLKEFLDSRGLCRPSFGLWN